MGKQGKAGATGITGATGATGIKKVRTPNAFTAPRPASGKLPSARPTSLLDARVFYCGDNLEQFAKLPDRCVDLIYIDPAFNSNRTAEQLGEVFRVEARAHRI